MKTVFTQKEPGGQWYWHTVADNGKIVADGSEGYERLGKAIHGFIVAHQLSLDTNFVQTKLTSNGENYEYKHEG